MKVKQLYIFAFNDNEGAFDREVKLGALALCQHNLKVKKIPIKVIGYHVKKGVTALDKSGIKQLETHGTLAADQKDVGVYLIGQGGIGQGIRNLQASVLVQLLKESGVKHIRKLVVLACNAASPSKEGFVVEFGALEGQKTYDTYLKATCAELGNAGYDDIMVAGWDRFVTINYEGTEHNLKPESLPNKEEHQGKKVVQEVPKSADAQGQKRLVTAATRQAYKKYYAWDKQAKQVVEKEDKDWHDK